jgi:hypothetical protein
VNLWFLSSPQYVHYLIATGAFAAVFGVLFLAHKLEERKKSGDRTKGGRNVYIKAMLTVNAMLVLGTLIFGAMITERLYRTPPRPVPLTPLENQITLVREYGEAKRFCEKEGPDGFGCLNVDRFKCELQQLQARHPDLLAVKVD